MTALSTKRCLGYYCDTRDRCAHYIEHSPLLEHIAWFWPTRQGEACDHFTLKEGEIEWTGKH